jgi:protein-S-isoprenylcysteine O-methyltransferase Ste14
MPGTVQASFEEAALIKLYGTQYEAYKQKVARFLPFLY